jgi:hypothetical protein
MTKWYQQEKDEVRGFYLNAPYDKIFIGCDPKDGMTQKSADHFDVFMNVSDSACSTFEPSRPGQHMHWYPVNEMGQWNLSYVFWLKTILDHHYAQGHRIYLHCHAGAYRSPSAAILWLLSRGHTRSEACFILKERSQYIYKMWEDHGNVHPLTFRVFEEMNKHPKWSLAGHLHAIWDLRYEEILGGRTRKRAILRKYLWFYFEPKYWLMEKKRKMIDWLKGQGWRHDGICTHYYTRKYFWSWPVNAEEKNPKPRN